MTTLRVTTPDDRSPFVVHGRGLSLKERTTLTCTARRVGLLRTGESGDDATKFLAEHPARVVELFGELGDAWEIDADAASERALVDLWTALSTANADGHAGNTCITTPAPGEAAVLAQGCRFRPYQLDGARRLWTAPGGLVLADSPGLGKTVQVLAALGEGAAVNVACPRNAVPTWVDEVARWRPDLTVRVLSGRRSATPARAGEVLVGTLESLPALEWADRGRVAAGAILVCDEAHALKGDSAQARRFTTWSSGVRAARGSVWLLSGTPVLNADPHELWRLLAACGRAHDTLGPEADLPRLFGHHEVESWINRKRRNGDTVAQQVKSIRWTGEHAAWVDAALARAIVRRTKEAVAKDLPPVVAYDVRVDVAPSTLRELVRGDFARRLEAELSAIERAVSAGAADDELDRLSKQPAVATARRLLELAKVPAAHAVLDELEAAGEPVLTFACHRATARALGERPGWAVIDGDVDGDVRGRIRSEFQDGTWASSVGGGAAIGGSANGVSMTIRAASESLTLTRSSHVVFVGQDWVPARNEQAIARAHRIGQARPVMVARLVADHPIDRRVTATIVAKEQFRGALLGGVEDR